MTDDIITPRLPKNIFSPYILFEISIFSDAKDAGNVNYNYLFISFLIIFNYYFYYFFKMFRHVPECSGMFHVPAFIDGLNINASCPRVSESSKTLKRLIKLIAVFSWRHGVSI